MVEHGESTKPAQPAQPTQVVELDRAPAVGAMFRRAAIGALPGFGGGAGRQADRLPDVAYRLRGVIVNRDRMAEYDRVCGFRLTDALPPTYPHVLAFPLALTVMSTPSFPFPLIGLVHVANRVTVVRPVDSGETLDLSVYAVDLRPHPRGRQLDIVTTASVEDEVVWRGTATYLRRERPATDGDRPAGDDRRRDCARWLVPAQVGTGYARVSGDHNPIHTSRLGAMLFGFSRQIAHGMWSKARCLAALEGRLPEAYTVDVSFKTPILLPATVAFSSTPAWEFALRDARSGKPHLTGTVR